MATVGDCERVQARWLRCRALAAGGVAWMDAGLSWVAGPDGPILLFPSAIESAALARGVERGRAVSGRGPVGVWLSAGVSTETLAARGFQPGWSPWWMSRDLQAEPVTEGVGPGYRVEVTEETSPPLPRACGSPRTWRGVVRTMDESAAGSGWAFLHDGSDAAGIFDMGVRPEHRRRGVGTAVVGALCHAARAAGAREAVLNATPEGAALYSACGFAPLATGAPTWWLHAA